jgi:hypothetical protein
LPLRDWIVLPILGMLTVCIMPVTSELIARWMFSQSKTNEEQCWVLDDPSTGVRGIPNSVCQVKIPESQPTEYRYNSCGHRAGMECGLKPPGAYRIVMTGSSSVMGLTVRREQTFAALLPQELSRRTGREIEVYNVGMGYGFTHNVVLRFNEVLAAGPDMILWVAAPMDIEQASFVVPGSKASAGRDIRTRVHEALARKSAWDKVRSLWEIASAGFLSHLAASRTELMIQHFLYSSQSLYVNSYLRGDDSHSGFLKAEPSAEWQSHLRQTDIDVANMEARASAAGIPFVTVLLPNRAQAAMISMGEWPKGFDPYKLDGELRSIVTSHGGIYLDILPAFRAIPNPEQYYFPVDGHPNAEGHRIVSGLLASALTSGAVPALSKAAQPQVALDMGR